ncbi:hypothetical protein RUM44_001090 [Polyplax serrata]|uniref:PH domain-containing protein n=1 Tax=Polyplax serrata TaxID=468196 RepID=A0ABR1B9G5_POLSC
MSDNNQLEEALLLAKKKEFRRDLQDWIPALSQLMVTNVQQAHSTEPFGDLKGNNTAAYQAHAHAQQLLSTHGDIPLVHDYHSL